mgnify:CR=1 FL=1
MKTTPSRTMGSLDFSQEGPQTNCSSCRSSTSEVYSKGQLSTSLLMKIVVVGWSILPVWLFGVRGSLAVQASIDVQHIILSEKMDNMIFYFNQKDIVVDQQTLNVNLRWV